MRMEPVTWGQTALRLNLSSVAWVVWHWENPWIPSGVCSSSVKWRRWGVMGLWRALRRVAGRRHGPRTCLSHYKLGIYLLRVASVPTCFSFCMWLLLRAQSCPTLCDPMDCGPLGSSVPGILQARILEWVAISFSRDLPHPGMEPVSLA